MLVYRTASVAMPRLRPRPKQENTKRAFHADKIDMGANAVGTTAHSFMHRKAELRVLPRRNVWFARKRGGPKRKTDDVNEENGRPGTNGPQAN